MVPKWNQRAESTHRIHLAEAQGGKMTYKTLTLKSVPLNLYRRLKKQAEVHRRSLNSEVIVCLEQSLATPPSDPAAVLARVDAFRKQLKPFPITDEMLRQARDEGRP